jgi:ribosomal protein L29
MTADYEALQVAMNDGDITDAGQVLGKLITAIDKLTSSMQEGLSTAQIFEMLIAHYTRVLRSDPLQKVALELLLQIEANYLRAQMDQSFKIALQAAQNLTEESLDALSQAELRRSRLLLKESQYALMQAIQEHQSQDKPVMRTLKRLIADQKHAAQLVAILLMPGPSMSLSEHKLLQTSQHRTVTSEAAFLTAVSQQQQMDFRGKSGEKGRCQKQPWVRALPPFHSGTAAAMAAATILDNADVLLSLLYRRQLQALENWEQTLEILLQPQVEGDDSCYGEGGTSGEEDSSSGAQPQPSPKDGADVLRNVQLMDLYDHIDKEGSAHIKKTQKPW